MEEADAATPPEAKKPRKCVQSKLTWGSPAAAAGNRGESETGAAPRRSQRRRQQVKTPEGFENLASMYQDEDAANNESPEKMEPRGNLQTTPPMVRNRKRQTEPKSLSGDVTPKKSKARRRSVAAKDVQASITFDCSCLDLENGGNSNDLANTQSKSPLQIDLRSEARISTAKYSELSAGKQMHPFFASRILPKNRQGSQDIIELDHGVSGCSYSTCAPIHVFDNNEVHMPIDWGKWVICDRSFLDSNMSSASGSYFPLLAKPSKLRSHFSPQMKLNQLSDSKDATHTIASEASLDFLSKQDHCDQLFPQLAVGQSTREDSVLSSCNASLSISEAQVQEGMLDGRNLNQFCLWTNKYMPENALEVCGNKESVKFLSEWLKGWHENGRINRKTSLYSEATAVGIFNGCSQEDDSEMEDCSGLNGNVILLTGPVGSGKTAAVYACAKEQGFNVVEVNSSDSRNGAQVRKKFGEATESHGLDKWSQEEINVAKLSDMISPMCTDAVIKSEGDYSCFAPNLRENNHQYPRQVVDKTLVLFEDVDTTFDEDTGFISTIVNLAATTKWPIVLTSNNKRPTLPRVLDQLVLEFEYPSAEELLSQIRMICLSEKMEISELFMRYIISSCLHDMRRAVMLLQFWCQGVHTSVEWKDLCSSCPLPFDLDAAHFAIPSIFSSEFRCELSERVYNDINQTILSIEEQQREAFNQVINSQETANSPVKVKKTARARKSKKIVKLNKDAQVADCLDSLYRKDGLEDFDDAPSTSGPIPKGRAKKRHAIVVSSDSDDGHNAPCQPNGIKVGISKCSFPNQSFVGPSLLEEGTCPTASIYNSFNSIGIAGARNHVDINGAASVSYICDTYKTQDVSCVPESYLMSESQSVGNNIILSKLSSHELSVNGVEWHPSTFDMAGPATNYTNGLVAESGTFMDMLIGDSLGCDTYSCHRTELMECSTSGYQLMDECSRADSTWLLSGKCSYNVQKAESVQDTWNKLRRQRSELKPCITSKCIEASKMSQLASKVSDFIAHSDLMTANCNHLDSCDSSTSSISEQNSSWRADHADFSSVYFHHGFGLYTEYCDNSINQRNLGLGSMTGSLPKCDTTRDKAQTYSLSQRRAKRSRIYDAIRPLVPAKLSMSLRGESLLDYTLSLSQISKVECSRLSESNAAVLSRRSRRSSHHYLSTGALSLSDGDIELLSQCTSYASWQSNPQNIL